MVSSEGHILPSQQLNINNKAPLLTFSQGDTIICTIINYGVIQYISFQKYDQKLEKNSIILPYQIISRPNKH